VKLDFFFVPFPREIWDEQVNLTQSEFRLLGWFLYNLKFGVEALQVTDDQILNGCGQANCTYPPVGLSRNSMKFARDQLVAKGFLTAKPIHKGNVYYLAVSRVDTGVKDRQLECQELTLPVSRVDTVSINKEKNREKQKEAQAPLPEWLPKEEWEGFLEMRKTIKKPVTPLARKNLITKLDQFRSKGYDLKEVLGKSIINCWQDVFPPRENRPLLNFPNDEPRRIKNTVGIPHD